MCASVHGTAFPDNDSYIWLFEIESSQCYTLPCFDMGTIFTWGQRESVVLLDGRLNVGAKVRERAFCVAKDLDV
jgi:hypothetical protein